MSGLPSQQTRGSEVGSSQEQEGHLGAGWHWGVSLPGFLTLQDQSRELRKGQEVSHRPRGVWVLASEGQVEQEHQGERATSPLSGPQGRESQVLRKQAGLH